MGGFDVVGGTVVVGGLEVVGGGVGVGVALPQLTSIMLASIITDRTMNIIFFIIIFYLPPFNNRENRAYLDIPLLSPPSR